MGVQINGDTGNISATKADYSGNVTIGGTLTYEDVTNIDSVGLVTARSGIEVGARPGVAASISVDGNMIVSGISTFGGNVDINGNELILDADADTSITADTDDQIDVKLSGSDRMSIKASGSTSVDLNTGGSMKLTVGDSDSHQFINGSDEAMRIDSSGRVLIGTTTEGSAGADEFTINTASGHGGMTIRNDTSSNGNIWFSDGTSGAAEYAGYIQYAHSGDHMVFGTAGAEKVRISSDGYVTKPNTPSFLVFPANNAETADGDVTFTGVSHNVGSHYNTSNGRFTAPVAGYYSFFANYVGDAACTSCQVRFKHNGSISNVGNHYSGNGSSFMSVDLSGTHFYMAANDYVQLNFTNNGGSQGQSSYMRFFGYLTH